MSVPIDVVKANQDHEVKRRKAGTEEIEVPPPVEVVRLIQKLLADEGMRLGLDVAVEPP